GWSDSAPFQASENGPPSMSPCAPWASRMRSPPPIWDCYAHPAPPVRSHSKNALRTGGLGALTPRCIYGRRKRRIKMKYSTYMESPVGQLLLEGDEEGLQRVAFVRDNLPTAMRSAV